jgi:hypothetical protein
MPGWFELVMPLLSSVSNEVASCSRGVILSQIKGGQAKLEVIFSIHRLD